MEHQDVLDELYHAFRHVNKPSKVEGCTVCCITEAELAELQKDLRSADKNSIQLLCNNAMSTIGNKEDFTYFLPRIIQELLTNKDFYLLYDGHLLNNIKKVGFDEWETQKQLLIIRCLLIYYERYCEKKQIYDILHWLSNLSILKFELVSFLDILNKPQHELLKMELIFDYLEYPNVKRDKILIGGEKLTDEEFLPFKKWVQKTLK